MPDNENPKAMLRQTKGFTLLEVLVAVTILGLAYVTVLQNFSVSLTSIARLGDRRARMLESALAFEKRLYADDEEEGGDETSDAPVFLEGRAYKLVIVTDEGNNFMSLKLTKL